VALGDPQPAQGQVWKTNLDGIYTFINYVTPQRVVHQYMWEGPDVHTVDIRDSFYLSHTYDRG